MTCLGSAGAARMIAASKRWWQGGRAWALGRIPFVCRCSRRAKRVEWRLYNQTLTRDEARLILRGLLAEETARELVEWVGVVLDNADAYRLPDRAEGYRKVLAKLRELELTK